MDAILHAKNIQEISVSKIDESLIHNGYAIIRGLFDKAELSLSLDKLKKQFDPQNDAPTVGETPQDVQNNFQKLLIGGKTQSDDYLTRFFRVFYNPVWSDDIFSMRVHFTKLIHVRNLLMGVDESFAANGIESNGLWSATRLHHYPKGGGFMSVHKDYIVDGHLKERQMNFYQLLLNMTEKGKDFHTGGAYVYCKGKKVDLEAMAEVGDIIIYDGRSLHGVEEVDPQEKLDLANISGRVVAFATLYNDKTQQNKISKLSDEVSYDVTADS